MAKRTYVLDTSVCLTDFNSIKSFSYHDVIIPLKVLEEIDKHKKRQDVVGNNARSVIRFLDSLREKGCLYTGVRICKGRGILSVKNCCFEDIPKSLDSNTADNQIISTAITEKKRLKNRKVIVVSRDINMRVICDSIGILSEDYVSGQIIKNINSVYTGFISHLVDDQIVDRFYNGDDIFIEKEEVSLCPNQFIMLVSNSNDKKTALARFFDHMRPLGRIPDFKNLGCAH